jgi:CPA1 family monovalent cation:H+ antiporter
VGEGGLAALFHLRYEIVLRRAEAQLHDGGASAHTREDLETSADAESVRSALSAERQRLLTLRADGTIGDPAFQELEQGLDLEELHLRQLVSAPGHTES